jgi:hypothetical protein
VKRIADEIYKLTAGVAVFSYWLVGVELLCSDEAFEERLSRSGSVAVHPIVNWCCIVPALSSSDFGVIVRR